MPAGRRWILIACLLIAGAAKADTETTATIALLTASELSLAVDMFQTLDAARRPGWPESGFAGHFIGRYPGAPAILGYFGGLMVGQAALYAWGPRWLSSGVSAVTLAIQIPTISKSFSLGLGFPF